MIVGYVTLAVIFLTSAKGVRLLNQHSHNTSLSSTSATGSSVYRLQAAHVKVHSGKYCDDAMVLKDTGSGTSAETCAFLVKANGKCSDMFNNNGDYCLCLPIGKTCQLKTNAVGISVYRLKPTLDRRLLWYDPEVNNEENAEHQEWLRSKGFDLQVFESIDDAHLFLQSRPIGENWLGLSCGSSGEDFVRRFNESPSMPAIVIFSDNIAKHKAWANAYEKVISVTWDPEEVVSKLLAFMKTSTLEPSVVALTPTPPTEANTTVRRLMWYDPHVNNEENTEQQEWLRSRGFHLQVFETIDEASLFLQSRPVDENWFGLSCGSSGESFVKRFNESPSMPAIVIFSDNIAKHMAWANAYDKVIGVTWDPEEVVSKLVGFMKTPTPKSTWTAPTPTPPTEAKTVVGRLIWFDPEVNNEENTRHQEDLKLKGFDLQVFENIDDAHLFLQSRPVGENWLGLSCGSSGEDFVRRFNEIPSMPAIVIFSGNIAKHKAWANAYDKVIAVTWHPAEVVSKFRLFMKASTPEPTSTAQTPPPTMHSNQVMEAYNFTGEEYCQGNGIFQAECKRSSCCQWIEDEDGAASNYGAGRCRSSIERNMCHDMMVPPAVYVKWDCDACMAAAGFSYCKWKGQFNNDGGCLPDAPDGYHVPCGSDPDDARVKHCPEAPTPAPEVPPKEFPSLEKIGYELGYMLGDSMAATNHWWKNSKQGSWLN